MKLTTRILTFVLIAIGGLSLSLGQTPTPTATPENIYVGDWNQTGAHNADKHITLKAKANADGTWTLAVLQDKAGTGVADVILTATTAATGTNWTAFGSQACSTLTILNNSGTTISARIGGAGQTIPIADGAIRTVSVAANASEVSVQRADTSNTQVSVKGVASR